MLLNRRYDDYVARYGPISRFTTLSRPGGVDPDTGEATIGRRNPDLADFAPTRTSRSLLALEVFDTETQTATKASIFSERVVGPREVKSRADSPEEAITICLDEQGTVTLERVATLLGIDAADARERLGTLVFDDPVSGELVPAARYLSGNVRAKLAEASLAATDHPSLAVNVVALEGILPEDLATRRDRRPTRSHLDRVVRRAGIRPRGPGCEPGGRRDTSRSTPPGRSASRPGRSRAWP